MFNPSSSDAESLKEQVRHRYGEIARSARSAPKDGTAPSAGSCCASSCCGPVDSGAGTETGFAVDFRASYAEKPGYVAEADLGLGCGLPVDTADLRPGQTVLDLGSGAGNDAFVAREIVGETGKVIGVDMTADMVRKARDHAQRLGYANVEFRLGELEALPVESGSVDRAVSNCVFNLVPDKSKAYAELFRVLKPGGRFSVSDIVLEGALPEKLAKVAELYAGCISGAQQKEEARAALLAAGLVKVEAARERAFALPDDFLALWLSPDEIRALRETGGKLLSVTWTGERP